MTTIAYRDGVMAAESLITADGMRAGVVRAKLARSPQGHIGGAAGTLGSNIQFAIWVEAGMPKSKAPQLDDDRFDALLVAPDGAMFYVCRRLTLCQFDAPFAAIGSGERYAMAAMEMGASAERAIDVAMKFDTDSGGDIAVMELGNLPMAGLR